MLPAIWHRYIFLFGLIGLAAGMLFGTVPTSIPQIILAANWLLEKDFAWKWQQLKSNKLFWILISFFILHVLGMIYTQNIPKGLDDLRNKMPLLTLPLILFTTKPLDSKEFKLLFNFFFLGVLVSSISCFLVYKGFTKKVIVDVRQASVFMSHIRFSLFIAFTIIALLFFIINETKFIYKIMRGVAIIWLLFFMYKLEMATGILCLVATSILLLVIISAKKLPKKLSLAFVISIGVIGVFIISKAISSLNMFEENKSNSANVLLEKTKSGKHYYHDTLFNVAENGNLIFVNICETELRTEWPTKSSLHLDDLDKKGNTTYYTLMRYLASKGLNKDSIGISKLNTDDVKNIERGNTNYKYDINSGLAYKWRELVWEYTSFKRNRNPSGHTLTMRLEFWKTATYIIKQNLLVGVGTGDVQDAFNQAYVETNSLLDMKWRLRSHNQYLAIGVAFGLIGLVVFIVYLMLPAFLLRDKLQYLYWPFLIIAMLSFITEDTLETQSGVSFFIFFQALFLWLASFQPKTQALK
jgi:hypothetical protein